MGAKIPWPEDSPVPANPNLVPKLRTIFVPKIRPFWVKTAIDENSS